MDCPSRTDDALPHPTWNQSPPELAADTTTRRDLKGAAIPKDEIELDTTTSVKHIPAFENAVETPPDPNPPHASCLSRTLCTFRTFTSFIGPGFLISVAYIDPGNYATDVAAGASTKFALLFVVLMSNLFAIFLQSMSIKLGSVTGLNLAENCRKYAPRWCTIVLYVISEVAIVATDIAEVIGSAIALNLLLHVPLVAGCAITIVDVLVILLFYKPDGSMGAIRAFEWFVAAIVLGVVICFSVELSLIRDSSVREVFRGYLPSAAVIESNGLYLSCGILGATVMPHSIFLGSGVVQSRLRHFDVMGGHFETTIAAEGDEVKYRPSVAAIQHCLRYSITELALSLFTFALFVNSAILIVAGSSLFGNAEAAEADLFGIHKLLSDTITPAAGTTFALALLLSGISAGIVCTMAGQMISEGLLNWTVAPWLRRLITRAISIIPSIIIAGAVGKQGLNVTLAATQVVLSVILPFVAAPLIYFTSRNKYMIVRGTAGSGNEEDVQMCNHWAITALGVVIWLVIAIMNVALLVLVGLGKM